MADHRRRLHPPADPQLRQRVFHNRNQRQLDRGFFQHLRRRSGIALGQPECADVIVKLRREVLQPAVHGLGKHRLGLVEVAGHIGVLRAAAREHEHHFGRITKTLVGKDAAGITRLQQIRRLGVGFGHYNTTPLKPAPSVFQRVGHIGQFLFGVRAQMRNKRCGVRLQRGLAASRDAQHVERKITFLRRRAHRCLRQNGMRIGPADAQRVYRSKARRVAAWPGGEACIHRKRAALEADGGVRRLIAQRGRHRLVVQRQRGLDQTRNTGGRVQMANVGFHRSDAGVIHTVGLGAVGFG